MAIVNSPKSFTPAKGFAALVVLAAIWAFYGVFARYLGHDLGLYEQWYLRFGIAFLLAIAVFHRQISWRKFAHLSTGEWQLLLFRAIFGQVIAIGFFTLAAERTQIGILTFMEAIPASSIAGILLFHERVSWRRATLIAVSFLGALLILFDGINISAGFNAGALLALVSTALYALFLVTRRLHSGELNNQEITVAIFGISTLSTYVVCPFLYHRWFIPVSHWSFDFSLVLVAASGVSVASVYLANYCFEHISAVVAGNVLMLEVFFGPFYGYLLYGEVLTNRDLLGGAVILLSVIAMNYVSRRDDEPAQIITAPD